MSKRKQLKDANAGVHKAIDDSFAGIRNIVDIAPKLEERKMEAQAFDVLIDNATDDEINEMYEKLLPMRQQDQQEFNFLSSRISEVPGVFDSVYVNTSGTTSSSSEMVFSYRTISLEPYTLSWPAQQAYKELAEYKARKVEIPKRLNNLQPDLGLMFSNVHDTVEKARNKIITVKQAISDMRDVLNHMWANLVDVASKMYPKKFRSSAQREFKSQASHINLAECLMANPLNRGKFQLLLDNMYSLYRDMSQHGKNPLNDDLKQLEEFYSRWIIHIDGVVGMINWKEWEDGYTQE